MNTQTTSQSQTNNYPHFFTEGSSEDFNVSVNSEKKLSRHDLEILDYNTKENESLENQNEKIKSTQSVRNTSKILQFGENIQDESLGFDIEFLDFNFKFTFEIIEIKTDLSSNEIVLYLRFSDNVIKITLLGDWHDNEGLYINNLGFSVEKKGETPTSAFLLNTLWAILGLSTKIKIQIPDLNQEVTMSFEIALNKISEFLQIRQIAYRLMVIEKTFKIKLPFPQFIDGKDVENIAFCYHAIVDREFDWFSFPTIIPWEANEESLFWLPKKNKPTSITFRPEFLSMSIFGIEIPLGVITAKIEKAVIDNYKEVKERLSKLDNSIVEVKLRSLNGISRTIAFQVPTLPKNSWSKDLQNLIDLDNKLDSKLLDRFFNLASSTLEGLTEEQKVAILERPDLDEDAFEI